MALEKGYYAKSGLDVEIRPGVKPGPTYLSALDEVAEGRATFGIGSTDVVLARANGTPLSIVSSIFQNSPVAIYTRSDTPVSNLADLMKLRFSTGFQRNGAPELELRALLRSEGVDLTDVRLPETSKPSFEAFVDGDVDVMPTFSLAMPWMAGQRGVSVKPIKPSDYGIHFYGDSIFTREDLVRNDPDLVARFVKASLEGWEYALNNPAETINHILNHYTRVDGLNDARDFNRW